ncbi:MAG TPA: phage portal protein [Thermoanaerobaculia bacterium]|nr:phage portal protein [Thermoanaerobaculia bacterium]
MGLLPRRRSASDSEFPVSQPANGYFSLFGGGGMSASGIRVDEVTAQSVAAVFACWKVIFETIATVPLMLYERKDERTRVRATDHRLYRTLHDEANEEMSATSYWETAAYHLVGWGKHFAEIEMNFRGDVIGLWPLIPSRTWMERKDGQRYFWTWAGRDGKSSVYKRLTEDRVLYIPGLSFDGVGTVSLIHLAREAIGQAMAVQTYGSEFWANGAVPNIVLKHPKKISDNNVADRLRASFDSSHQGLGKRHRTAILEEGMGLEVLSVDPEKAQAVEIQHWVLEQCARYYRMPLHKIGELRRSTNNNIEHQDLEFHRDTMQIHYRRIAQAVNRQLLGAGEKRAYFSEFLVESLLRADSAGRAALYKALFEVGGISPNEIASRENLPPAAGGDRRFFPLNFGPLEDVDKISAATTRAMLAKVYAASGIEEAA